jgi:hypothetical protein
MKARWALCALAAWLMGSLMMFVIAPTNFRLIDQLLAGSSNASFHAVVERAGAEPARELLRYLASELNRTFFFRWNVVQTLLGVLALQCVPPRARDRWSRPLVLAATIIAIGLLGAFTPLITSLGRGLDFVPRVPPPPELARFQLLHVGYTALELVKVGIVATALYRLVRGESAGAVAGVVTAPGGQRA